ncbi:MAG TPA: DUF488 domain-containing protein [Steroidobacter sp.]|uniref:DUF488 domain-containing protein n=1 Tax=Steroidobacter sp. TaxID=1978227 RepID=UPI002ED9B3F9
MAGTFHIKRIYDPPAAGDGARVLVDRLWPRGISKEAAKLTLWLKEVAPSPELRKWFGHDPERWQQFQARYRAELKANSAALAPLYELQKRKRVTLLYSAHDEEHNQARVLAEYLRTHAKKGS